MALSSSLRKVASKVVSKFGGTVTFRRITDTSYNTTTGSISQTPSITYIKGVLEDVTNREVSDLIKTFDKKLTISASDLDFEPTVSDQVEVSSRIFQIIQINKVEQNNTAIIYELILRS